MRDEFKTICDTCGRHTWYETEQRCHCSYFHDGNVPVLCKGTLRIIDKSDLDDRFTRYYDTGERVEVEWQDGFEHFTGYGCRTDGKKARFYVGKSMGWKPIYLQIYRRDSSGGMGILSGDAVKSIRGLRIYKDKSW